MRKLPALIGATILTAARGFVGLTAFAADAKTDAKTNAKPAAKADAKADAMTDTMADTMSAASTPKAAANGPAAAALTPAQTQFFETKVRPILSARCYKCHSVQEGKNKGGLVLDTREGWQKG